jgi:hypothetical protein
MQNAALGLSATGAVNRRTSATNRALDPRQASVENLVELVDRQCDGILLPVDEKRRSGGDAELFTASSEVQKSLMSHLSSRQRSNSERVMPTSAATCERASKGGWNVTMPPGSGRADRAIETTYHPRCTARASPRPTPTGRAENSRKIKRTLPVSMYLLLNASHGFNASAIAARHSR